jgi:hypothetical protein
LSRRTPEQQGDNPSSHRHLSSKEIS